MVIDKTTGRGCAWSIVSKTITKKLIAESIIDKPIFRKPHKTSYQLLRVKKYRDGEVYVTLLRGSNLTEEPLWVPSFIDAGTWEQAVSRFRIYRRLDINVENYLLPEMDEYLENIPDAELVSMIRDFLIEQGVINTPICQRAGNTYYFNENEVYSLDRDSRLFPYKKGRNFDLFRVTFESCFNMNVWRKAVSQFVIGTSLKWYC